MYICQNKTNLRIG